MVRFGPNIKRLAVYMYFGKNTIKFGQNFFCIPKYMHSRTLMCVPHTQFSKLCLSGN